MAKTIDEKLFEQMIRIPHIMRKRAFREGEGGPDMPMHHPMGGPVMGPCCPGPHPGPHPAPGPEMGPFGEHGPCGPGPGPHHGPGKGPRPFTRERILTLLQDSEGGLRQKEVGEALKIGPSATSEFIDKLENDGYVRRTVDPDDKRATRLVLTEMGDARASEVRDQHTRRIATMFSALTEEEKEELLMLLEKLTKGAEPEDK